MREDVKIELSNGCVVSDADVIKALHLVEGMKRMAKCADIKSEKDIDSASCVCVGFIGYALKNLGFFEKQTEVSEKAGFFEGATKANLYGSIKDFFYWLEEEYALSNLPAQDYLNIHRQEAINIMDKVINECLERNNEDLEDNE